MSEQTGQLIRRVLAIAFIIAAMAYAAWAFRKAWRPPEGSSERLTTTLACLKCQTEWEVADKQFGALTPDARTGGYRCPKCGEAEGYIASLRCPKCQHAVPRAPQLMGGPFVCPFCQAPLAGGAPAAP